jgi:hypothetical protein
MKLSQMTTEQATDTLVRIAEPVANIMDDPAMKDVLQSVAGMNRDTPMYKVVSSLIAKVLPLMLKSRRDDTYSIISAMTGKELEQIEKQNILVTLNDCRDFIDKDFIDFFRSSGR